MCGFLIERADEPTATPTRRQTDSTAGLGFIRHRKHSPSVSPYTHSLIYGVVDVSTMLITDEKWRKAGVRQCDVLLMEREIFTEW